MRHELVNLYKLVPNLSQISLFKTHLQVYNTVENI